MIEPVDPFQGCELHGFEVSPRASPVNDLGLVESVDGFGQGVVVGISDATNERFDAGFSQPFGVLDRDILDASVAVMERPPRWAGRL